MAEELHHITEGNKSCTSNTQTSAPSETSKETAASRPEEIDMLSPIAEPLSTGERQLATLAESLHIVEETNSHMNQTIATWPAITAAPSFGVIDPTMGHMMDPDDAAIHRAIGPD